MLKQSCIFMMASRLRKHDSYMAFYADVFCDAGKVFQYWQGGRTSQQVPNVVVTTLRLEFPLGVAQLADQCFRCLQSELVSGRVDSLVVLPSVVLTGVF